MSWLVCSNSWSMTYKTKKPNPTVFPMPIQAIHPITKIPPHPSILTCSNLYALLRRVMVQGMSLWYMNQELWYFHS